MKLNDLTVIITRPLQQNSLLKLELEALGINTISFPCIEISGLSQQQVQFELKLPLADYDLICFTSPNSVACSKNILSDLKQLTLPVQLAAVGRSTAEALHAYGFENVIVPKIKSDSEALLDALAKHSLQEKNILIVKGVGGRQLLRNALQKKHCTVHTLDVYKRLLPHNPPPLPDHVDLIMFTSSESVENFIALTTHHHQFDLLACQTIVGHPRISAKATALGFKKLPIIATSPTDQDMLIALQQWVRT